MTRTDYELVTRTLADQRAVYASKEAHDFEMNALNDTMVRLADAFSLRNPRFNRALFYRACGMEGA